MQHREAARDKLLDEGIRDERSARAARRFDRLKAPSMPRSTAWGTPQSTLPGVHVLCHLSG
jgi:hypothetical protein